MPRINKTFRGSDPFWANACVGNNGFTGYWGYAQGFSKAANLLIEQVLQGKGSTYYVDEFIYPVCFNMRHSVELRLKGAISELLLLEERKNHKLEFDLIGSHNISNIWSFFTKNSNSFDDRYININRRLNTTIIDIAEIDATGQTFRYPLDTESQKHLIDVSTISFFNLKENFLELELALDELHMLNIYLSEEYYYNTFTKKLSRKKIFEIASKLPNINEWKKESFKTIKTKLKSEFKIGSKELSESINIIKTHFELAPLIGISVPLLGLLEKDILYFVDNWLKLHNQPSEPDSITIGDNESELKDIFQSMKEQAEIRQEVWKEVNQNISPEILAGLSTLFYFAQELKFSEEYALSYEDSLKDALAAFNQSKDSVKSNFFHIFNKTSAVDNILKSLFYLKKVEIAEKLVSTYNLEKKHLWLDDARKGNLFNKPDYYGYTI